MISELSAKYQIGAILKIGDSGYYRQESHESGPLPSIWEMICLVDYG